MCRLAQVLKEVQAGMVNGVKHGTLRSLGMVHTMNIGSHTHFGNVSISHEFLFYLSVSFIFSRRCFL